MSKTAEDVTSTLSRPGETNDENVDQIAELLTGGPSETEDKDDEEIQTIESKTEDDEISDEETAEDEQEEEETSDLEAIADTDDTWESVLNVDEGNLSYDEEGNINGVNVKVNGESSTVGMKDLIAGYQTNKAITQKGQNLADERKVFDGLKEQAEQAYASKLASVDALTKHFEQQLISEYDNINWDELRNTNPAEYAAARQDFSSKAGELQRIQEAIKTDVDSAAKTHAEDGQKKAQVHMKEQYDLMIVNNPEWSDAKVLETAKDSYKAFVKDQYGFKDTEFDSVFDSRLIELIKDAKSFREGLKVATKKKQKAVPRFQKSAGTGSKKRVSKLDKLTAASKKAKGSQKRDLQQSAVAELLIGGT